MTTNRNKQISLINLSQGMPGLSSVSGAYLAEASAVCFESQYHKNGVELQVNGSFTEKYDMFWPNATLQMFDSWNDDQVSTEFGAYGVAIPIVYDLTGLMVIKRSKKGTGFDYWLGNGQNNSELPFQNAARLEVSGIRSGNSSDIKARVKEKIEQTNPSDNLGLPAYVAVVEFSAPVTQVVKK